MTNIIETNRIFENLAYIKANRLNPDIHFPAGWIAEAEAEARAVGILPPQKAQTGINCRPGIDRGIIYGGDLTDIV